VLKPGVGHHQMLGKRHNFFHQGKQKMNFLKKEE